MRNLGEQGVNKPDIRDLENLVIVDKTGYANTTSPVQMANAKNLVRPMPIMDEVMTSRDQLLEYVFSRWSFPHRKTLAEYL